MKKITKIRIKYILISICLFIVFATILPTFMRYNASVTAYVAGDAKETRSSTYTVIFHSNGGTGQMNNLPITYGVPTNLTKNTFTNSNYNFAGWNTQADGQGTSYVDEQSMNLTSYITGNEINLYATWTQKAAVVNGTYFDTLQQAINSVQASENEVTVTLLKNVSETLTIGEGKNIYLNLQNFTVSNNGNTNVISNSGTLRISNGTISSSASTNGAVNNNAGAKMYITGGSIISTGGRQALYNNGGTVEISGNASLSATTTERPAVTNNTVGSKMTITGGTIVSTGQSGIENKGVLTIGTKDGTYNSDALEIKGKKYGVTSTTSYSFYDGIIKGITNPINDLAKITSKEDHTGVIFTSADAEGYKSAILDDNFIDITFNANGGDVSETTRTIYVGDSIGTLPTTTRVGHIFNGWFTAKNGGEEVTSSYSPSSDITIFAHWTARNVVQYNNNVYPSVKEALKQVPNNTKTVLTILENTSEAISIPQGKNIVLDLNGNTISNYGGNFAVIKNEGVLEIINGNVQSNVYNGAIDNEPTGTLKISGVRVTITTDRQAVYNNGGYVEITDNSYLEASPNGIRTGDPIGRATVQNMNGGTIIASSQQAIGNSATLTLGEKDGDPSSVPVIIGADYGILNAGTLNYYDGIIKGINDAISGNIDDEDQDLVKVNGTETINNTEYKTLHLEQP